MEVNPIAVILVHMDSKGDRLLYRYPYQTHNAALQTQLSIESRKRNVYAINNVDELQTQQPIVSMNSSNYGAPKLQRSASVMSSGNGSCHINFGNQRAHHLQGFADEVLSTLFAVKPQLCNQKFELKVNDVRFVSHPTLIQKKEHQQLQRVLIGNVVVGSMSNSSSSLVPSGAGITGVGGANGVAVISSSAGTLHHNQTVNTANQNLDMVAVNTSISTPIISASSSPSISSLPLSTVQPVPISTTLLSSLAMNSSNFASPLSSTTSLSSIATGSTLTVPGKSQPQQMLINVVFALHAQASYSIVKCYHELSKRLGLALKVEEQRTSYLTEETTLMARSHDEISTQQLAGEIAFDLISERSSLAQALKSIYHDLCTTGLLSTSLNQNLTLSFCLPQKAHQLHKKGSMVDPETIDHCLHSLKPYHGMLLLVDFAELLDCVPPSGARMLLQLVEVYTPLMSLQNMAHDADLSLEHVYKLVSHLVYWAKATIIYPLCETNVYVIAPDAPLHTKSHLVEKFTTRFPGMSLFEVIADFSLPTSIGHLTTPLQQPARQGILAQMVLWMLQHHLLMQLHTYVQFMPSELDDVDGAEEAILQYGLQVGSSEIIAATPSVVNKESRKAGYSTEGIAKTVTLSKGPQKVTRMNIDRNSTLLGHAFPRNYAEFYESETLAINNRNVKNNSSICDESHEMGDDDNEIEPDHDVSDDDELNAGSLLSISSPLPVPNTTRRSITEDHFSVCGSTASDNIAAQPSSSHKSNFSITASMSTENCDSLASLEEEEKIKELLEVFDQTARAAIRRIPASMQIDDLSLMVKLYQAGYFKSEHHLEEIMYFENLRRSQLLQLLDKFRDVLIIYETEDPAIASMYHNK